MKKESSAGGVVFFVSQKDKSVKYLLLRNDQIWGFPKGKLEPEETLENAAIREIKEETDLDVELISGFSDTIKYTFTNSKGEPVSKEVTFFLARALQNKVTISEEHVDSRWLSFKDTYKKITYINSRKVLERANQVLEHII